MGCEFHLSICTKTPPSFRPLPILALLTSLRSKPSCPHVLKKVGIPEKNILACSAKLSHPSIWTPCTAVTLSSPALPPLLFVLHQVTCFAWTLCRNRRSAPHAWFQDSSSPGVGPVLTVTPGTICKMSFFACTACTQMRYSVPVGSSQLICKSNFVTEIYVSKTNR